MAREDGRRSVVVRCSFAVWMNLWLTTSHISATLYQKACANLFLGTTGQVLHLSAGGTAERFDHVIEVAAAIFRHTDQGADRPGRGRQHRLEIRPSSPSSCPAHKPARNGQSRSHIFDTETSILASGEARIRMASCGAQCMHVARPDQERVHSSRRWDGGQLRTRIVRIVSTRGNNPDRTGRSVWRTLRCRSVPMGWV